MANSAKAKGTRNELKVRDQLEARGWSVVKAGGSLGMFDLVAIHPDKEKGFLVQVKSNRQPPKKERNAIASFPVPPYMSKLVWIVIDNYPMKPIIEYYSGDAGILPVPPEVILT